jgi:2-polyprenyl-6-hydroxyphenyl methylase/3-demethylubiquinone-9 3-methyltransferase
VSAGEARFEFGANWQRFLSVLSDERIASAEASLREMLGEGALGGRSFLDVGCGSGLFSLAARRLGARVHSFDYDPKSVACAQALRTRYFDRDAGWTVEQGSALDSGYLERLGRFDVVYAWGVLHHTGRMWDAVDLVARRVAPGGLFFVALYNDQGARSRFWRGVKRTYVALPRPLQVPFALLAVAPFELYAFARALARGDPGGYVRTWTQYWQGRGMSKWHDIQDWVGGYPFEVATPAEVERFLAERGFEALRSRRTTSLGCNEFVVRRARD